MAAPTVVVTGASGFLGHRVLDALAASGSQIVALTRRHPPQTSPSLQWVVADLEVPSTYEHALVGASVVLHLAAATGKATSEDYRRSNVEATRILVQACERAGVGRFVLVSSIAATFRDRRYYPYAESKIDAEALVQQSRLRTSIVRPTMIFGPGSKVEQGLTRLACLPLVPMFGDGQTMVQPVHVDDVARLLVSLIDAGEAADGVIEIGGPDTVTIEELLKGLRGGKRLRGRARFVHLPLDVTRAALAVLEKGLLPILPITAGQLATFANDGIARPHPLAAAFMAAITSQEIDGRAASGGTSPLPNDATLADECRTLATYLTDSAPTTYQIEKYIDGHRFRSLVPSSQFDGFLFRTAQRGAIGLRLADAYAGALYRGALLRAKLVLVLAILESSRPTYRQLDAPTTSGPRSVACWMAFRGLSAACTLGVAVALLAPVHLWHAIAGRTRD